MKHVNLTKVAILLLCASILCSFMQTCHDHNKISELRSEVAVLKQQQQTKDIISVEQPEYEMVRSFVDVVTKAGGLSTQEADTYINQLNEIISLQKQVDRLTPTHQRILNLHKSDANDVVQTYIANGWRIKQISYASSGNMAVLIEK